MTEPTRDHVFPESLGGRLTVPTCKQCNSRAGTSFEAPVLTQLASIAVKIALSGAMPAEALPLVGGEWKHAFEHDGISYSIFADGHHGPTKPKVDWDDEGQLVRLRGSKEQLRSIAKDFRRVGYEFAPATASESVRPMNVDYDFSLSDEQRRFAVKCSLCTIASAKEDVYPDVRILGFLADARTRAPVSSLMGYFPGIDPFGDDFKHLTYVEAEGARVYSVVRLYNFVQVFSVLATEYRGPEFAYLHTLDPATGTQALGPVDALRIPTPLKHQPIDVAESSLDRAITLFNNNLAKYSYPPVARLNRGGGSFRTDE